VVVRGDIPIQHQAVQAIHAGIASARELIPRDMIHPSLVLCTVPSRSELESLSDRLMSAGIVHRFFYESNMEDQPTALASEPVGKVGRKAFQKLPLFTGT